MPADKTPTTPHFAPTSISPRTLQNGNSVNETIGSSPRAQNVVGGGSSITGSMGGISFEDVGRWDEKEVSVWLQSVKLSSHAPAFVRNDIAGLVLFDVDTGFLKEMGISSVGDRIRITSAIKTLRKKCTETDAIKRQRVLLNEASEMEWMDGEQGQGVIRDGRFTGQESPLVASSPLIGGRGGPTLRDVRGMGANTYRNGASGRPSVYANVARPSTTAGSTGQSTLGPALLDDSPTSAFFTPHRPSTADGRVGQPDPSSSNSTLPSITESSHSTYSRSSLGGASNYNASPVMALDDVRKKTIKFIGEDGTTKVLAVADCRDAYDVLARVLRKFGKSPVGNSYKPTAGQALNEFEDVLGEAEDGDEQWGIFATSREGHTKYLTDSEVLAICHAPQYRDPLRERGLELRRINRPDDPAKRPTAKRPNKVERILGISPNQISSGSSIQPPSQDSVANSRQQSNRASTVSILTGLGVNVARSMGNNAGQGGKDGRHDSQQRPPPSLSIPISKKARNFFGQRPPSELISSHLTDFFPATEKRVLERTVRRSVYGRPSTSLGSKRDSTWSFAADPDAPPLPHKEYGEGDAPAILIGMDTSDGDGADVFRGAAPILPPPRTSTDEASRHSYYGSSSSLRYPTRPSMNRRTSGESTRSRQSLATKLRAARGIDETGSIMSKDRSDTASMLTVDEITQEVENRRESMNQAAAHSGWVVDEDGVPIPLTARNFMRSNIASSIAGSMRPGSHRSVAFSSADNESELERRLSDDDEDISAGVEDITQRPSADAPGEELDRHLGDPMARLSDDDDPSDGLDTDEDYMDADEDDNSSGEEGDGEGGVYHSAAPGREPIKWIKGALIGAGSFGSVFLGMNAKSGLLMAVKQVELPSSDSHSDQRKKSMLEALEREIELLKMLQHENIVQYLDSYADATHLNIFLEYVPGGSVAALLRNYGAFEEPLVRNFVKQILHGLSFLHSQDIVHRDIKGANILVDNKSCIKISDFGISKKTESGLYVQHRPSLQGSVFWMAPEVVKQTSYTRKADIWSLGCLVVEMISGTHPWANLNQMQALYQIGSHAKPAIPDEISPAAIDFLNKTFELDHLQRPSAEELLEHPFITEEYVLPSVTSPTS